ncbi:D-alanine--D-alanine ligase [bacterium]|nr:D-alanine--D-alanine ligase [bacterium]
MNRIKHKICLIFGGCSAEHEVSLSSAASVYKNLNHDKYEIFSIYINKKGFWKPVDSPLQPLSKLQQGEFYSFLPWGPPPSSTPMKADVYFPVLHGPYGEDGTIQGLLDMADVPYVGASVLASSLGMDKAVAKKLYAAHHLPVTDYVVVEESDWREKKNSYLEKINHRFPLPFFVKPANLGSSVGITKIKEYAETEAGLRKAFRYDRKVIVEEGIQGREIECSVLGNDHPRASLPGEIIPHREFYDYKDKYVEGKTSFGIPAQLPDSIVEEIQRIAIEAYKAIDCSGMARVDFFLQNNPQKIFLNEINTIPGFTEISMYPKLWEVSGMPFSQLLEELIHLAQEKHQKKNKKSRDL